jgi:hypothetical protein
MENGSSIGDGIIVLGLAAAFIGYFYFKHRERLRRLEIIHQERLVAMEKGIPLPELPIDPAPSKGPADPHIPLILGTVMLLMSIGSMFALYITPRLNWIWVMPLPLAMLGIGLLLYYFLAGKRKH